MSYRILSENCIVDNDTRATGLNNNDLIVGPSGAGKTRSYVKPNILQCNESLIVTDTKNSLKSETEDVLRKNGYKVLTLDLTGAGTSSGYNPLDYIRYDPQTGRYNEQDIMTLAATLMPVETRYDPFWELSARTYLECIISYVLECLRDEEHTLDFVVQLVRELGEGRFKQLIRDLRYQDPESFAVKRYQFCRNGSAAEKTTASVLMFLTAKLGPMDYDGAKAIFHKPDKIDFTRLGREKTAVFLTVSDSDRSMDRLASVFYAQALHILCDEADRNPTHRLDVPVRLILDDFAANMCIPDFDKIISMIRSREIYASIILQSISQLEGLYGHAQAMTIVNNCDHCLYLGGQDIETARYMGIKANKPTNSVLNMPLDSAWLFTRGEPAKLTRKYDLTRHPRYCELPEGREWRVVPEGHWPDLEEVEVPA